MINFFRILITFLIHISFDYLTKSPQQTTNTDIIIEKFSEKSTEKLRLFYIIIFLVAYHLWYRLTEPFDNIEIIYLAIIVMGCGLRIWAFITLDKFFTFDLCIRNNHKLITHGPYKWLMHPSYTGLILFEMFALLYFGIHYVIVFIIFVLCLFGLIFRINREEKMLQQHIPNFDTYAKKRWRLFPFIY